jgi:predicted aldo/keto reductase-like oxidoreductase
MARVADYSIVTDAWVIEAAQHSINFDVPSNIDPGSRSVLNFMLSVDHIDDMTLVVRINSSEVWNWTYKGDSQTVMFFQEVVSAGVVKPGTNTFSFHTTTDDATAVQFSDVVVWCQANI